MKRPQLSACFSASVVAALLAFSPSTADAQLQPASTRWEPAIQAFEQRDQERMPEPGGVLFVGSSSIRGWDTDRWFPERNAINRGFGGSQISDLLQYAERIVWKYKPAVIVFYSGDNDIAAGKPPQRVIADFKSFADQCARRLPDTQLIYLPIKPSRARWKLWPAMSEANAGIKQYVDQHDRFHYLDTATPLLGDDGQPRSDLLREDGLHLNDEGYRIWSRMVEEKIGARS